MATVIEELRTQTRDQLRNIKSSGMTVAEIATKLEVTTATVYQLLDGETTPTAKVLCNSCRNLQMSFQVDGHRIGAIDFPTKAQRLPTTEVQLGLFEMAASVAGDELSLTIKKLPSLEIELGVRLTG